MLDRITAKIPINEAINTAKAGRDIGALEKLTEADVEAQQQFSFVKKLESGFSRLDRTQLVGLGTLILYANLSLLNRASNFYNDERKLIVGLTVSFTGAAIWALGEFTASVVNARQIRSKAITNLKPRLEQ